jgi:CRP/FNR family transcriptional regulator, polysaccharide utilization system transcription regulator
MFRVISCQFIPPDEFLKLQKSSLRIHFEKGEVILKQGVKSSHLVFLQSGIVKFSMEDETGKGLILTIKRAPAMIGGADAINNGLNLYSLQAVEACDVCFIDYGMLLEIAMTNSLFMLKLMEMMTGMYKASILNFINLAHKQVNGRIADILLYLSRSVYQETTFMMSLTRKEIAEFAGCSTENVINTLSKFHREAIIAVTGKRIEILDAERLERISKTG